MRLGRSAGVADLSERLPGHHVVSDRHLKAARTQVRQVHDAAPAGDPDMVARRRGGPEMLRHLVGLPVDGGHDDTVARTHHLAPVGLVRLEVIRAEPCCAGAVSPRVTTTAPIAVELTWGQSTSVIRPTEATPPSPQRG